MNQTILSIFIYISAFLFFFTGISYSEDVPTFTDADLEKYGSHSGQNIDEPNRVSAPIASPRPASKSPTLVIKEGGRARLLNAPEKKYEGQGTSEPTQGERPVGNRNVNINVRSSDEINEEQSRLKAEEREKDKLKFLTARGLSPQSKEDIERNIFSLWSRFRSALSKSDMMAALECIAVSQRSKYKSTLEQLHAHLKEVASDLGNIENCKDIEANVVSIECDNLKKNKGEAISNYVVQFVRDMDGNWRIYFF